MTDPAVHALQLEVLGGTLAVMALVAGLWWWLHRKHGETQGAIEGVRVQISDNTDRAELQSEKGLEENKTFRLSIYRQFIEFLKSVANHKEPK